MLLRQFIVLAFSIAGGLAWWSYDYGGSNPTPMWIPAMIVWVGQTIFWFGWFSRDGKLLLYLGGAWIGVMASIATLGTFVGAGVAASADQQVIRIALVIILFVPVLLLPRLKSIWPGATKPRNIAVHGARSLFVVLQYACVGLLMLSLIQPPRAGAETGVQADQQEVPAASTAPRAD